MGSDCDGLSTYDDCGAIMQDCLDQNLPVCEMSDCYVRVIECSKCCLNLVKVFNDIPITGFKTYNANYGPPDGACAGDGYNTLKDIDSSDDYTCGTASGNTDSDDDTTPAPTEEGGGDGSSDDSGAVLPMMIMVSEVPPRMHGMLRCGGCNPCATSIPEELGPWRPWSEHAEREGRWRTLRKGDCKGQCKVFPPLTFDYSHTDSCETSRIAIRDKLFVFRSAPVIHSFGNSQEPCHNCCVQELASAVLCVCIAMVW